MGMHNLVPGLVFVSSRLPDFLGLRNSPCFICVAGSDFVSICAAGSNFGCRPHMLDSGPLGPAPPLSSLMQSEKDIVEQGDRLCHCNVLFH